jgi:hypothetical protein
VSRGSSVSGCDFVRRLAAMAEGAYPDEGSDER